MNSRIWLGALACVLAVAGCSSSVPVPGATATSAATSTSCLMVPASTVPGAPFESEVGCSDGSGAGYVSPPPGSKCTADNAGTVSCSGPAVPDRTAIPVPPPVVLPADAQALRVTVPFSADQGTLVLADGPGPQGISEDEARTILGALFAGTDASGPAPLRPHVLLAGRVSLAAGFGAPALDEVPAWVMIYQGILGATVNCAPPPPGTYPPAPAWASGLHAIIITNGDPSTTIAYDGAGTGLCVPPRAEPIARVAPTTFE